MNTFSPLKIEAAHEDHHSFYIGNCDTFELSDKLILHEFDFKCQKDFCLDIKSHNDALIYLIINLDAKVLSGLTCNKVSVTIPALANMMLYFQQDETISFFCEADKKYNFLLLQVRSSHFESDQKMFLDTLRQNGMFHNKLDPNRIIVPNLKVFETAKTLKLLNKSKYCNKFIALGHANIIIGHKVGELLNKDNASSQVPNFRQFEIQQLERITREIEENPHLQYTVRDVCKKSGLSVSKLQLGFKQMHNCTVAIFIRNVRLDKALEMLHDSDLNV